MRAICKYNFRACILKNSDVQAGVWTQVFCLSSCQSTTPSRLQLNIILQKYRCKYVLFGFAVTCSTASNYFPSTLLTSCIAIPIKACSSRYSNKIFEADTDTACRLRQRSAPIQHASPLRISLFTHSMQRSNIRRE